MKPKLFLQILDLVDGWALPIIRMGLRLKEGLESMRKTAHSADEEGRDLTDAELSKFGDDMRAALADGQAYADTLKQ